MTPGYPLLPRTRGFGAAVRFGDKMGAGSIHLLFPKASLDGNLTTVGEGGCVKSGHVAKCESACAWAVDEPEGGYAVASRC